MVLLIIGGWLFLTVVLLLFFRSANLKKPYPKPPQGGKASLYLVEPIIYPPYPKEDDS